MATGSRATPDHFATTRLRGIAALVVGLAVLVTLTVLFSAGTAMAQEQAPDARYYVSTVTAIEPAVPGLDVVVHGGGQSITLTNHTGARVVVLGYSGEDYLRFDPGGVTVNTNSLTAALNANGGRSAPPTALTKGKPPPAKWRPVAATAAFTWQDFRTQWSAEHRPPIVTADPHARHQVFAWAVQLRVDGRPTLVRGTVTWTGSPVAGPAAQLGAAVVIAVLVTLLVALALALAWRRQAVRRRAQVISLARSTEPATFTTGSK